MFQIRSNHRSCGDYRSRVYDASRAVGCGRGGWAAVGKLELHGGGQLGQAAITCTMRSPILHKGQHTVFVLGLLRRHHPLSVLDTVAFHSRETDGGPAFLFSVNVRCYRSRPSHRAGENARVSVYLCPRSSVGGSHIMEFFFGPLSCRPALT